MGYEWPGRRRDPGAAVMDLHEAAEGTRAAERTQAAEGTQAAGVGLLRLLD